MTPSHDLYSAHAAEYAAYRPSYPPALFAWLAAKVPACERAWDCGTGSGQAAIGLANHFGLVIATDASSEQVRNARPHPRVEYAVAPADHAPLADGTADLVTVAQALHWFDFDRFYAEVRRVCRPGGLLAVWTYERALVTPAVDAVLDRLGREFVNPYWPPERVWVDAGYRTIPFPFPELVVPHFDMTAEWDLPRLLHYLATWSATKRFVAANRFDPVERLTDEFRTSWGDPATVRPIRWPLGVRVGQVHP